MKRCAHLALAVLWAGAGAQAQDELPLITVTADDTVIDRSCRIEIPEGARIVDAAGDGVIKIEADGVTVEFVEGKAELIQSEAGTPWHTIEGVGIRIEGRRNVTLRGAHVHRYKIGIWATEADGLVIEGADVSGGYADRLRSTPERSVRADQVEPHANDGQQWRRRYGAGICVERSGGVTIRESFARRRQNGIILDRCAGAQVYDNDFSFLSGWGLAMWRTTGSTISRNAFDFCVRGYAEGVYLDGQGAAGMIMFEQCSDNVIAGNSATHGGRGLWIYGGSEATGQTPPPEEMFSYTGLGCNDNLIIGNDFSFAAMRGIDLAYSFNNRIIANRFVECAASGVWASWSQYTLIAGNEFIRNGQRGNGLERGGVNIAHGAYNVIRDNVFTDNRCGVHLWAEDDEAARNLPWARANDVGAVANQVIRNTFTGDAIMLQVRGAQRTAVGRNTIEDVGAGVDASPGAEPEEIEVTAEAFEPPEHAAPGERTPVGARAELAGRDRIVMGDSFPWDHAGPIVRHGRGRPGDAEQVFELLGAEPEGVEPVLAEGATATTTAELEVADGRALLTVRRIEGARGYLPFRYGFIVGDQRRQCAGAFLRTTWRTTFFRWSGPDGELTDPVQDLDGWRARAVGPGAVTIDVPVLDLRFAGAGPGSIGAPALKEAGFESDRFGLIARTRLPLAAGAWRLTTESDDGVRVMVDGATIVENWTRHAPVTNTGVLRLDQAREVEIVVEHFEDRGYAVVTLEIEPIAPAP
ncbi:MAG: right-handed parallel beta-helix repeat-containing protein [Phycisphaerales bacterium JB039]